MTTNHDDDVLGQLPSGVAISWGIVKQGKRGPKGELSIKQIVDAAITIADKDGLPAVSMNRVAQALGYTPMSLYRYITSKEDLLLLMQEAACDVALPPAEPGLHWRDGLREYVNLCVEMFVRHPWYNDIPVRGIPITPNIMKMVDWPLRVMRDMELDDFEKMSVVLLVSSYSRSIGLIRRDIALTIREGRKVEDFQGLTFSPALKQLVTKERFPDLYPLVMSGIYAGEREEESTVGDDMDFGLERILDGVEQYLERSARRKSGETKR